jgi:hypothetical protein
MLVKKRLATRSSAAPVSIFLVRRGDRKQQRRNLNSFVRKAFGIFSGCAAMDGTGVVLAQVDRACFIGEAVTDPIRPLDHAALHGRQRAEHLLDRFRIREDKSPRAELPAFFGTAGAMGAFPTLPAPQIGQDTSPLPC